MKNYSKNGWQVFGKEKKEPKCMAFPQSDQVHVQLSKCKP